MRPNRNQDYFRQRQRSCSCSNEVSTAAGESAPKIHRAVETKCYAAGSTDTIRRSSWAGTTAPAFDEKEIAKRLTVSWRICPGPSDGYGHGSHEQEPSIPSHCRSCHGLTSRESFLIDRQTSLVLRIEDCLDRGRTRMLRGIRLLGLPRSERHVEAAHLEFL